MRSEIPRSLQLSDFIDNKSLFVFGPRATGKTSLIESQLADRAFIVDLLDSKFYLPLCENPARLQEMISLHQDKVVVIDEIQKFPAILDEVHRLIEKEHRIFLLTGSSARKLKRENANMLGGRASQTHLHPLTWFELDRTKQFDLDRYLRYGSLPRIYLSNDPQQELYDYVDTYITQEIQIESEIRNLPAFSRFLRVAALHSGDLCNYAGTASDVGLSAKTIKDYFEILDDTLLGYMLTPWRSGKSRKSIAKAKHYLFDCGVMHTLSRTEFLDRNSNLFGRSFEHFILNEVRAYNSYKRVRWDLCFWRSKHGAEVDIIINDECAIEVKSTAKVSNDDIKGLVAIGDEGTWQQRILVSQDPIDRYNESGLAILGWTTFLKKLWQGDIL